MYGETFYGRHTAQHQLQWRQIKIILHVYRDDNVDSVNILWYLRPKKIVQFQFPDWATDFVPFVANFKKKI